MQAGTLQPQAEAGQSVLAGPTHLQSLTQPRRACTHPPSQRKGGAPVLASQGQGWGEKPVPVASPVVILLTRQMATMHVWMSVQPLLLHGQSL